MNIPLLIVIGIAAVALVVFLIMRNQKDEKEFERQLNNDYRKTKDEEGDIDTEEKTK